jgi:cobalt/nickel transport system permease protein
MHVPDGFLSGRVWAAFDAVSGATILYAARRLKIDASARVIPLMGVLSAFVFAAQMLNFPLVGGTSGHLIGGALLSIVLGPLAAFVTMATVVIAQALFLQDGGLAALGANIFNIAAVPVLTGYGIFRLVSRLTRGRLAPGAFLAGWGSLVASAACCALELALSGAVALGIALPVMVGYHALIGLVEGALTAGALALIGRVRPNLLEGSGGAELRAVDWLAALALVALPCVILMLAGSSTLPDPLEKLLQSSAGSAR